MCIFEKKFKDYEMTIRTPSKVNLIHRHHSIIITIVALYEMKYMLYT